MNIKALVQKVAGMYEQGMSAADPDLLDALNELGGRAAEIETVCSALEDVKAAHDKGYNLPWGTVREAMTVAGLAAGAASQTEPEPRADAYPAARPNQNWTSDAMQFPRLLAEIMATQGKLDLQVLATSMDLTVDEVNELFDRADVAWERIKGQTTPVPQQAYASPLDQLSVEQRQALTAFRIESGPSWRAKLLAGWVRASYPGHLQAIRNEFGPEWLATVKEKHFHNAKPVPAAPQDQHAPARRPRM